MVQTVHIGPLQLRRRSLWRLGAVLAVLLLLFLLRVPLLRAAGAWLVVEDAPQQCEAIFVLSGNAHDRGMEAARLYADGFAPRVVCLGGETNPSLEMYDIFISTSEVTQKVVQDNGVPANATELLQEGTSTFEEFEAILALCKARGWVTIMVVSSRFHTRRIHEFFRLRLHFEGIRMVLRGAQDGVFEEEVWWKSEPGLIFVNNEYVKLMYYWLKY